MNNDEVTEYISTKEGVEKATAEDEEEEDEGCEEAFEF